jgi:hypothetical protein
MQWVTLLPLHHVCLSFTPPAVLTRLLFYPACCFILPAVSPCMLFHRAYVNQTANRPNLNGSVGTLTLHLMSLKLNGRCCDAGENVDWRSQVLTCCIGVFARICTPGWRSPLPQPWTRQSRLVAPLCLRSLAPKLYVWSRQIWGRRAYVDGLQLTNAKKYQQPNCDTAGGRAGMAL